MVASSMMVMRPYSALSQQSEIRARNFGHPARRGAATWTSRPRGTVRRRRGPNDRALAVAELEIKNAAREAQADGVGGDQRPITDQDAIDQPEENAEHQNREHAQRNIAG